MTRAITRLIVLIRRPRLSGSIVTAAGVCWHCPGCSRKKPMCQRPSTWSRLAIQQLRGDASAGSHVETNLDWPVEARDGADDRSLCRGVADHHFNGRATSRDGGDLRNRGAIVHRNRPGNLLCGFRLLRPDVFRRRILSVTNPRSEGLSPASPERVSDVGFGGRKIIRKSGTREFLTSAFQSTSHSLPSSAETLRAARRFPHACCRRC